MDKMSNDKKSVEDIYWLNDYHFKPLGYQYMAEAIQQGLCDPTLELADQLCISP